MATYAIGDVQGCFEPLQRLLARIQFRPDSDRLWFAGDLVNRGPASLDVLRYVKDLGDAARVVLGNHDLFLLAVADGLAAFRPDDTLEPILTASDREDLLTWLRHQRLCHQDQQYVMVHAGLLPQWTAHETVSLAREAEAALSGPDRRGFLQAVFQKPAQEWTPSLTGMARTAAAADRKSVV